MTSRGPIYTRLDPIKPITGYTFSEIPARIPPPNKPLNQTDFPNPVPFFRIEQTWVSQRTPPPPPNRPYNQYNCPNPTPPHRIEQTTITTSIHLHTFKLP